jgi:Zn-dependent protease with chaperone function
LNNVSVAATRAFARNSKLANTTGNLIAYVFSVLSWVFASGFAAAQSLNTWVGRSAEFQADQRVVRLGYGKELAAALRRTQPSARVSKTHPPARTRIARIEASLRQKSGTTSHR